MRIKSIEIETDEGRRKVAIDNYVEVDPAGDMPIQFESLCAQLWQCVQRAARGQLTAKKAEPS